MQTSILYDDEWFKTVLHINGQLNCYNNLKKIYYTHITRAGQNLKLG